MLGKLQKLLYTAGLLSPVGIIYAIFISITAGQLTYRRLFLLITCVVIAVLHYLQREWVIKRVAVTSISLEDAPEDADMEAIFALLEYVMPFVDAFLRNALSDVEILQTVPVLTILVCGATLFLALFPNGMLKSPIWMIGGYHYHKVTLSGTRKNHVLLSKKKTHRRQSQVSRVKRVFEGFLIEGKSV